MSDTYSYHTMTRGVHCDFSVACFVLSYALIRHKARASLCLVCGCAKAFISSVSCGRPVETAGW